MSSTLRLSNICTARTAHGQLQLTQKRQMCERSESMSYFSSLPKPLTFLDLENLAQEKMQLQKIRHKFVTYEVTSENMHRAIHDLRMPIEILRHFDEKRKSNSKFLAPLSFFGFKSAKVAEPPKTIFNSGSSLERPESMKFKGKIADLQMVISRKKEKGQNLATIPEIIAENLQGMDCETYFDLSRNISNLLWYLTEADRCYHDLKTKRQLKHSDQKPTVYDFATLSEVFENIFYDGYKKLSEPDFSQLSGSNFLNFLKWRSICHAGPYLYKSGNRENVAIYVMGQFECLKIFNFGRPLHGLYLFETKDFKNPTNYAPLPAWFLDNPAIIDHDMEKMISDFKRESYV